MIPIVLRRKPHEGIWRAEGASFFEGFVLAVARPPPALLDGVLGTVVITRNDQARIKERKEKIKEIRHVDRLEEKGWEDCGTYAWALGSAARSGGKQLVLPLGRTKI